MDCQDLRLRIQEVSHEIEALPYQTNPQAIDSLAKIRLGCLEATSIAERRIRTLEDDLLRLREQLQRSEGLNATLKTREEKLRNLEEDTRVNIVKLKEMKVQFEAEIAKQKPLIETCKADISREEIPVILSIFGYFRTAYEERLKPLRERQRIEERRLKDLDSELTRLIATLQEDEMRIITITEERDNICNSMGELDQVIPDLSKTHSTCCRRQLQLKLAVWRIKKVVQTLPIDGDDFFAGEKIGEEIVHRAHSLLRELSSTF